jgi:AbrB family looped-hinge helix DNA binding protein
MTTSISSKGQIVLPAEIRRLDSLRPGEQFNVERIADGEYLLRRKRPLRNSGLVNLLVNCPVKGWFQPLSRDERTDQVRQPPLE